MTSANGASVEARALLDNASSASFITERLTQSLRLPRVHQNIHVSGIAGSSPKSPTQSIASLQISPAHHNRRMIDLTAIVMPRVTCDLPVHPVPFNLSRSQVDPAFGQPSHIGVDVFVGILLHGRRTGPPGSPVALETEFGWVLSGSTEPSNSTGHVVVHVIGLHSSTACGDDILRKFWESPTNSRWKNALPYASLRQFTDTLRKGSSKFPCRCKADW